VCTKLVYINYCLLAENDVVVVVIVVAVLVQVVGAAAAAAAAAAVAVAAGNEIFTSYSQYIRK